MASRPLTVWKLVKVKSEGSSSWHKQTPHPLVQFEPGGETFAVLVLEPKEPGFPQPDSLYYLCTWHGQHDPLASRLADTQTQPSRSTYLVKEVFASGAGQDGKLQLSIHGCYSNIYLPEGGKKWTLRFRRTLPVLCHWTSLSEQQLVKATAIIVCSQRQVGSLTAKWPKRGFLTFFCSTRSIQSQEVGGDYNKTWSPHYSRDWEDGFLTRIIKNHDSTRNYDSISVFWTTCSWALENSSKK